jgi:DNA-directed RNA polymerase subunit K/omega
MLSRYEATRVVGLRALHLSQGATPNVHIQNEALQHDMMYVAALELSLGKLDAVVKREDGTLLKTNKVSMPPNLNIFLDLCDGGVRSYRC